MTRLVAVRHAPTEAPGLCYGRAEVPTRLPAEPAAAHIRARLEAHGLRPGTVWSSPSRRCAGPAAVLARALDVPHRVADELQELDYGRWEGRPWRWLEAHDARAYRDWMSHWQTARPPGGESVPMLEARVRVWWQRLAARGTSLAVAHAGVIRALRVICGGATWPDAMRVPVVHLEPEEFP